MSELKPVLGILTKLDKVGATHEIQEPLGTVMIHGPHADVGCELSYTMNLGNYQSARMQVSIKVPSDINKASLDASFQFAHDWCDEKLSKLIEEAKSEL